MNDGNRLIPHTLQSSSVDRVPRSQRICCKRATAWRKPDLTIAWHEHGWQEELRRRFTRRTQENQGGQKPNHVASRAAPFGFAAAQFGQEENIPVDRSTSLRAASWFSVPFVVKSGAEAHPVPANEA
jgi:hypothetical protein